MGTLLLGRREPGAPPEMRFKRLGWSQVQVPEIGLGTANYTAGVEPLRVGIEHGACFIDTAEIYGSEETVGKAIAGYRSRVFVATKVAPRNFRRQDLIAAAENSLRRIGTDYIDLYQLHWPRVRLPIEEPMAAMEELADAGKIRFIGVSNFLVSELKKAQSVLSRHRIVSNQVCYNLIDRTIEGELLDYCRRNGICVIAFSPFGMDMQRIKEADREGVLARLAQFWSKTEAQIALNWVISHDNVVAIPKAGNATHVVENCAASGWSLPKSDYALLEAKIPCLRHGRLFYALRYCKRYVAQSLGRKL